ncbi:zf-TFIIB domain-containing protein [uncultured Microbacterium sp.]
MHDDAPNCPECQHRMEAVELKHGPVWKCPQCGFVVLS